MKKFIFIFISLILAFYIFTSFDWYSIHIATPVGNAYAAITNLILAYCGLGTTVNGISISSPYYSLSVAEGCDAVVPLFIICIGIIFIPMGNFRSKWQGVVYSFLYVFCLNIVRIISLFLIGAFVPSWFEFFHIELWQSLFVLLAISYFFYWIKDQAIVA